MAKQFNLTIQLALKGPGNLNAVVANINKQLGNVSANVNIKIAKNLQANVNALNKGFQAFNSTLATTQLRAKDAAAAISDIAKAISQVNQNTKQFNNVNNAVNQTAKNLKNATSQAEGFGKAAGLAFKRFAAFSTITAGIFGLTTALTAGVKEAIDFEKELVKVSQVTGTSLGGLKDLTDEITRLSVKFGVSSKELLNVSSTLAQAGLSARDTKVALDALAQSALAPSFKNMAETTEGAIAIMAQFGLKARDLEKVLGSINTVSNKFAVESQDIIAAVRITGGAFAATSKGVSEGTKALNEFMAVFTSIRATTRESAESIATGLRTIFTRLERKQTVDALKDFGVNLADLEGKFVGPYEAVNRLSDALNQLDPRDFKFSGIVEELGGYRQIGKVIPLIQQAELRFKALKAAEEGVGSLAEDAAVAQQSLGNRIAVVTEQFLALIRAVAATDSFKAIVNLALDGAEAFIKLADAIKPIIPFLGILATAKLASAVVPFTKGFVGAFKGKADGGPIHKFARGGFVPGTGNTDSVKAMLQPGEFVLRKKAVQALGSEKVSSLNKYANGGYVQHLNGGGRTFGSVADEIDFIKNSSKGALIGQYGSAGKAKAALNKLDPSINASAAAERKVKAETAAARKAERKEKKLSGGLLDVFTTAPGPVFGAVAYRVGDAKDSFQEATLKSLTGGTNSPKAKEIATRLGTSPQNLDKFKTNLSLNLIDPEVASTFSGKVKTKFTSLISGLIDEYGGGFSSKSKGSILKDINDKLDFDSVGGFAFEGLIAGLSGQKLQKARAGFDFPIGEGGAPPGFKKLFGDFPSTVQYLDAKSTLDRSTLNKGPGSVLGKAVSEIAKNYDIGISSTSTNSTDNLGIAQGSAISARKAQNLALRPGGLPFARGGSVQKFATGGEVMQNREQVQKLIISAAQAAGIKQSGLVSGVEEFSKEQLDELKSKGAINPKAAFNPGTRKMYYTPGVSTVKNIIHELGHAFDAARAREMGLEKQAGAKGNDRFYASRKAGSTFNKFAEQFRFAQFGRIGNSKNAKFVKNRLEPHELFADNFAFTMLGKPALAAKLKFASGGPTGTDTVPAMLTPGEFVVNKKAASKIGLSTLHKLNHAEKFAKGGPVGVQHFVQGGQAQSVQVGSDTFKIPDFSKFDALGTAAQELARLVPILKNAGLAGRSLEKAVRVYAHEVTQGATVQKAENAALKQGGAHAQKKAGKGKLEAFDKRFFSPVFGGDREKAFGRGPALNFARGLGSGNLGKNAFEKFKGLGPQALGIGALVAGPAIQSLVGRDTAQSAGIGAGATGLLGGAAAGSTLGPVGTVIGGLVGAISSYDSAFIEKQKEIEGVKIKESLESVDSAFETFNKNGNLNTLDKAIASTVSTLLEATTSASQVGIAGGFVGKAGLGAAVTQERGFSGLVSDILPFFKSKIVGPEELQADVQKRSDAFLKVKSGDLLEQLRPTKERAEANIEARLRKGEGVESILKNTGIVSAVGFNKENKQEISQRQFKVSEERTRALSLAANGDTAGADKATATANEQEAKIKEIQLGATKRFIDQTKSQIELTNKLIQAFQHSDKALGKFTFNLDRLESGLSEIGESSRFRDENFNAGVSQLKSGDFNFATPQRKVFGSGQINDQGLADRQFDRINKSLGGGLDGFKDLQGSLKGLNQFKESFRDTVLSETTTTDINDNVEGNVKRALDKNKAFDSLPNVFKTEIKRSLTDAFSKRQAGGATELNENVAVTQVEALVGQFSKNLERISPILDKIETQFNAIQDNLRNGLNAAVEIQLAYNSKIRKVSEVRLSQENDFNRLLGKELTIDQQAAPGEVRSGGKSVEELANTITRNRRELDERPTFGENDGALIKAQKDLAVELAEAKGALEHLATDTSRLSAIQEKFAQVQAKKGELRDSVQGLLGAGPEELIKRRGTIRDINSGQRLRGDRFTEALNLIKTAPGRTEEDRQKAATNFTRRQLGPAFDKLPKAMQDALTNVGDSPEEKELITQFKKAQKVMLDATIAIAKLSEGDAEKVFNAAVNTFEIAVSELRSILQKALIEEDKNNPQTPQTTPPQTPAPSQKQQPVPQTVVPPTQQQTPAPVNGQKPVPVVPQTQQTPNPNVPATPKNVPLPPATQGGVPAVQANVPATSQPTPFTAPLTQKGRTLSIVLAAQKAQEERIKAEEEQKAANAKRVFTPYEFDKNGRPLPPLNSDGTKVNTSKTPTVQDAKKPVTFNRPIPKKFTEFFPGQTKTQEEKTAAIVEAAQRAQEERIAKEEAQAKANAAIPKTPYKFDKNGRPLAPANGQGTTAGQTIDTAKYFDEKKPATFARPTPKQFTEVFPEAKAKATLTEAERRAQSGFFKDASDDVPAPAAAAPTKPKSPLMRATDRRLRTSLQKDLYKIEAKDKKDSVKNAAILKREEDKELFKKRLANDSKPLKDREASSLFVPKGSASRYQDSTSIQGAIEHNRTDVGGDITEKGQRIDKALGAGRGLQGQDARDVFATQKEYRLASVRAGQQDFDAKQRGPNGQAAVAARVRGQGTAVQAAAKAQADSVRAQGSAISETGETFQQKYKRMSQADSGFGSPIVSAVEPVNKKFEEARKGRQQDYEAVKVGRQKQYESEKASKRQQFLDANPSYAPEAAKRAAAGNAPVGTVATAPQAAPGPNFEGFVTGVQQLNKTAETLSKIPTKIEVGVTIAPVEVIINGASVLAGLQPEFQSMIVDAIKGQMNKQFNVDGSQREIA